MVVSHHEDASAAMMAASLPLPRNHAYLEDASAVAVVTPQDEVWNKKARQQSASPLPVLFLDFVLFPESILPIRLMDHSIVSFLKRKMLTGEPAKLGVVYKYDISFLDCMSHADSRMRFTGAIGTVATITFTHVPDSSMELVVTAIGGNRFEIMSPDDLGTAFYRVQELPLSVQALVGPYVQHLPRIQSHNPFDQTLRRLSMVSTLPFDRILSKLWPPKQMREIEVLLNNSAATSMLTLKDEYPRDPEAFSFWLSANLAIDQPVKVLLLKAATVAERLALLKRLVEELDEASATFCCRRCQSDIAMVKDTFAVPGADGVSGNYVNPHGCLHQTITVHRLVNDKSIFYSSGLESKDSWFPGYRWAIMHCANCREHLGWRFEAEDRFVSCHPPFFGLSSSQVLC